MSSLAGHVVDTMLANVTVASLPSSGQKRKHDVVDAAAPPRRRMRRKTNSIHRGDAITMTPRACFRWAPWVLVQACAITIGASSALSIADVHFASFLKSFSNTWSTTTMSTAFSGIGGPEVAVNAIDRYLGASLESPVRPCQGLWAIECSELARKEYSLNQHLFNSC